MFYKFIQRQTAIWFSEKSCPVRSLIDYMVSAGKMRDAQIEAVKCWLFLKIACENRPLWEMFASGKFNTLNFDEIELTAKAKTFLENNPAAAALFEYASFPDESGKPFSPKVLKRIKEAPESLDYVKIFQDIFYNVSYTDYLFSLPMGAGKTYLMAAFIYLDLYFAENEPGNPVFAHNFVVLAPSGLKSSVVPSLRTIQNFDPSWVIPEPSASNLKRKLIFEVLDQNKSQKNSNRTKNPNVQKIAIHQPPEKLFGLVAVTNAEKVILDRVDLDDNAAQPLLIERTDDEKDSSANELRSLIGKLPGLSIFIDEVHHAAKDDKKLRAVVNKWAAGNTVNSVIGFSGTPYLEKKEKINLAPDLSVANLEISNIVYYYPLVDGIGNFLKKPTVKIASGLERLQIVEKGIRLFLETYKDLTYHDGTCAKLGIYCGSSIETLEEDIFPLAARIAGEFGLNPAEAVLRYHGGNRQYPKPVDSDLHFASLDKPISRVRIVLLVQIGKEGWDCRSLTGIVLAQEGDCPTNMVLQTSCRCLRQVQRNANESALIYLNSGNASILDMQLKQQHHISIQEFEKGGGANLTDIQRYSRMEYLKLPKVDFYQLKVSFLTETLDTDRNPAEEIRNAASKKYVGDITTAEMEQSLAKTDIEIVDDEKGTEIAHFNTWLSCIVKESFGFVTFPMLNPYETILRQLFDVITYENSNIRYFSSKYEQEKIKANIRKAFYEKRDFTSAEELIPEAAALLKVENFTPVVHTATPKAYYPEQPEVEKIIKSDRNELLIDEKKAAAISALEIAGLHEKANEIRQELMPSPHKDRTYHYLPYHTDSKFERTFLEQVPMFQSLKELNLEVYYNGDRALTEFKIKCYRKQRQRWIYIGMYTPDFLIIRRKDGAIHQAIIVETKGNIYAGDKTFQAKRDFMEKEFIEKNNEKFGFRRFDYLYLEDTLTDEDCKSRVESAIKNFFEENTVNAD